MDRPIRNESPPTRFAYKLKFPIIARMFKARKSMAPKESKRKRSIQLSKARESKRRKSDDEESNLSDDLDDEIPTFSDYNSDEDDTFNAAIEKLDEDAAMEIHVEEWLSTLHRDDKSL